MESERKRKRAEKLEATKADDQTESKGRERPEAEVAHDTGPPPTEEEVEEFFAILRRMRVAVKYFGKEALSSKVGGCEPQSSTAVEVAADGGRIGGKRAAENGGLDLNTVPEAESSSV